MLSKEGFQSRVISLAAVFAAMTAVLDIVPIFPGFYSGIWDSWAFLLSPLIGVLLGPYLGAFSVGLGTLVGHMVYFRNPYELVFMIGAPLGALMSGFTYRERWQPVFAVYSLLLVGYFITPVSWLLPLWGIWDVLVGYALVIVTTLLSVGKIWPQADEKKSTCKLLFSGIIGLESDILLRIFILIPGQTYWFFYGLTPSQLQMLWLAAAFITPIKVAMATIVCIILGMALKEQVAIDSKSSS